MVCVGCDLFTIIQQKESSHKSDIPLVYHGIKEHGWEDMPDFTGLPGRKGIASRTMTCGMVLSPFASP